MFAITLFVGSVRTGGHYTSMSKRECNSEWFYSSFIIHGNEKITVLKGSYENVCKFVNDSNYYASLLFYTRDVEQFIRFSMLQ